MLTEHLPQFCTFLSHSYVFFFLMGFLTVCRDNFNLGWMNSPKMDLTQYSHLHWLGTITKTSSVVSNQVTSRGGGLGVLKRFKKIYCCLDNNRWWSQSMLKLLALVWLVIFVQWLLFYNCIFENGLNYHSAYQL